jgi:hypothetical protein
MIDDDREKWFWAEIDRLRTENATLRELVREALPSMEINYPVSRADWIERAERALEGKQ